MNIRALATDYDGTIAWHGAVEPSTCRAFQEFKDSGRKLLLVTGREMHDLLSVFGEPQLFDIIVAENGGVLYHPATKASRILAPRSSPQFVDQLRHAGVHPLSVGEVIVATQENYYGVVARIIQDLALDLRIIMNKGALMVLPSQINKATGLLEALYELGIPACEVAGVGDAENDFVFLELCGFSAAVANALPGLKSAVNLVTRGNHGCGVEELLSKIMTEEQSFSVVAG